MNRSAKNFLRIAAIAISCMMLMSLFGAVQTRVLADNEETTYTVRILPGAKGTAAAQIYEDMHYGDTITYYVDATAVNDEKYYAKGLKDSGMDNNDPISDFSNTQYLIDNGDGSWTIIVTKDQDFVISYGLQSSIVSYVVNYVNAAGTAIAPSSTFYGSLGDMPVISYQYVEGYEPVSNDLTYLTGDGDTFTFVYAVIEVPTEPETTTAAAEPTPAPTPTPTPEEGGGTPAEGEGGAATPGGEGTPTEEIIEDLPTPTTLPTIRTYNGFTIAGEESESGLGEGTTQPDEDGLINIEDDPTVLARMVNNVEKSRYSVYGADNEIMFTYKYDTAKTFEGITAFAGSVAEYLKK